MIFQCPHCDRPIYNRRINRCEFCHEVIPESLLLSDSQIAQLDQARAEEEKRYEALKKRMAETAKKREEPRQRWSS